MLVGHSMGLGWWQMRHAVSRGTRGFSGRPSATDAMGLMLGDLGLFGDRATSSLGHDDSSTQCTRTKIRWLSRRMRSTVAINIKYGMQRDSTCNSSRRRKMISRTSLKTSRFRRTNENILCNNIFIFSLSIQKVLSVCNVSGSKTHCMTFDLQPSFLVRLTTDYPKNKHMLVL